METKMNPRKHTIAITLFLLMCLGVGVFLVFDARAFRRDAVTVASFKLRWVLTDWINHNEPHGKILNDLLLRYGSTRPFLFEQSVMVEGSNVPCVFAITSDQFPEGVMLAITRGGTIVMVSEQGNCIYKK